MAHRAIESGRADGQTESAAAFGLWSIDTMIDSYGIWHRHSCLAHGMSSYHVFVTVTDSTFRRCYGRESPP